MINRALSFLSDPPCDRARLYNAPATMTASASPTQSCRRKVRALRFRFIAADVRRSGMNMGLDMTVLRKHAGPLSGIMHAMLWTEPSPSQRRPKDHGDGDRKERRPREGADDGADHGGLYHVTSPSFLGRI
jgi:hypothetical protein